MTSVLVICSFPKPYWHHGGMVGRIHIVSKEIERPTSILYSRKSARQGTGTDSDRAGWEAGREAKFPSKVKWIFPGLR